MKYIDADLLREKIAEQMESLPREVGRGAGTITSTGYGMMQAFQIMRSLIDSLQQEQPSEDLEKAAKEYANKEFPNEPAVGRWGTGDYEPPVDMEYPREVAKDAFIEGYEQAEKDLGWIPVKDRLPDTTAYVFTCIEMNGIPQCVGFHYYKDGKWFEGFEEDTVGAVEYWMPIPKLPKEV